MLQVQIPRLHVGVVKVLVNRLRGKARRTSQIDGVVEADRTGEGKWNSQRWISTRCRYDAGHRLVYIDSVRAAQHGLSFPKGHPGKAHARLKVLVILMIDGVDIVSDAHQG